MGAVETVTVGAVTYNVYGLGNADPVGDADDYFGGRLGATAWTGATADQKAQALVSARRWMDRATNWSGAQTVASQTEEWPRDGATCDGTAVPDGTTPDDIVYGEFELALALLDDATAQNNASTGSNLKRAKAGSAEVEFFRPTQGSGGADDTTFPLAANQLLACYFDSNTASLATPFVDGTDGTADDESTHFDSCTDDYGLNRGL